MLNDDDDDDKDFKAVLRILALIFVIVFLMSAIGIADIFYRILG